MMPAAAIAMLDRFLAKDGEDVVLRRTTGAGPSAVNDDVQVRASVQDYQPQELVGGIAQTDSRVIMSPSEITKAQWPGGELPSPTAVYPAMPRRNDKLIVGGRTRNIEFVNPVAMHNTLVRIELRISG